MTVFAHIPNRVFLLLLFLTEMKIYHNISDLRFFKRLHKNLPSEFQMVFKHHRSI